MQPIKHGQAWKFIASICREVRSIGDYGTHLHQNLHSPERNRFIPPFASPNIKKYCNDTVF